MLLIASYEDIKTREINDEIWIIFSPIGIIITFIIAIIISIIIYYSKFVGGADSKALITLSFLDPINLNKNTIHHFNSIIVLTNSCIISLIIPLFLYLQCFSTFIIKKKIIFKY